MIFSHDVIICTQERTTSLEKLLNSLTNCHSILEINIAVIENTNSALNRKIVENLCEKFKGKLNIKFLHSKVGLPRSRNLGIAETSGEVITFLDDDVLVPPNYFIQIDAFLFKHSEYSGYGPKVEGTKPPKFLSREKAGKVSKIGAASWFYGEQNIMDAEWIPGCAMTYKRQNIGKMRFNEGLENGPCGGYALGEDVDFGLRFSKKNRIAYDPDNVIYHTLEEQNRASTPKMERAIGVWHGYLLRNYPERISTLHTLVWIFLGGIKFLLMNFGLKRSFKFSRISGFISEIINPKLASIEESSA